MKEGKNTVAEKSQVVVNGNRRDVSPIPRPGRDVKHFVGKEENAKQISAGTVVFPAGTESEPHCHAANEEVLYVLAGTGKLICDGVPVPLEPESYVFIPPGVTHSVVCDDGADVEFFYSFSPPAVVGTW